MATTSTSGPAESENDLLANRQKKADELAERGVAP